jgi:hypothetical protein
MKRQSTILLAAAIAAIPTAVCRAIVSSNGGANAPYSGLNINDFLGADRFYSRGYTGSRAIVSNIEAGHMWNGHETLGHVTTLIDDPATPPPNADFDFHATYVGATIGGRLGGPDQGEWQRGIAFGADLWSASIASSWNGAPPTLSFNFTGSGIQYPCYNMMIAGIGGRTTDVVNMSWGFNPRDNSAAFGRILDAMVGQSGKTLVTVAHNFGETANPHITAPGANFNSITAGALASDISSPPYNSRATFSDYGPNDFWNPQTAALVPNVLAAVDLAAPGTNLTLAYYGGATGGNTGGTNTPGNNLYTSNRQGTSFAAPIIAGGATLLADVGKDHFGGGTSIDGRIIKSVLMNSASKTAAWSNGQTTVGGVITTTQSLDWGVGAGRINLSQAFSQYTLGTSDVPGAGGGNVHPIGWDYGQVAEGAPTDYFINAPLQAGSTFTATLDWFMDNSYNYPTGPLVDQSLDNLDLEVWTASGGAPDTLVARSSSIYNNVEHLNFAVPQTGQYMLRVKWTGEVFDRVNDANLEQFGLAWAAMPTAVQWTADSDGNWSDGANWSGLVPNVPGARADFGAAITVPHIVVNDAPKTLGQIAFDNLNAYTVAGPGTITMQTFGGESSISVQSGQHIIAAPVDLQSSTTLDVAAGGRLTISGTMTSAAYGITLTKAGAGAADISRARAGAAVLNQGTVRVLPNGTAASTSIVKSLTIASSPTPGVSAARLDLTDNALVVDYDPGADSPLARIANLIREGHNAGAWDGNGIATSHGSATEFALGYGEASALSAVPPIFGLVDSSAVLVRFTRYGDTDLNGLINFDDYVRTDNGFNNQLASWINGDFDYNGVINFDDYVLIDFAFNNQDGTLRRALSFLDGSDRSASGMSDPALRRVEQHFGEFGDMYAGHFLAAVPEPASCAILAALATPMLLRRHGRVRRITSTCPAVPDRD